ncbi:radical SAM protein [Nocardia abscessus]|uniref:radical SAM protein n=1 Tax=Nocardia abscessus TaxID=120957 RepID=UPI002454A48D|nr:radical SAM protein [Nocardia abscessus]
MTTVPLPTPGLRGDGYGHARMPRRIDLPAPERIDRVAYGRFRNVYLYITEACQLRCEHCYMGERLERALKMPLPKIAETLTTWRKLGGSKLTLLGGEPTLHPYYCEAVRLSRQLGYEHVITTMVHAVVAEPYTVSLVIRGQAIKDKFLVMDRKTGEAWWQYGATQESAEDALRKRMTPARLQELIGSLDGWQLF